MTKSRRFVALGGALLFLFNQTVVQANPTDGQVVAGGATIEQAGSNLTVKQSSNKVIINWQDFSIGAGEVTKFVQPSSSSAALNRVVGDNLSGIYGTLQSNGQIYLINPNGIVVGATGVINTGGFTASTQDLANQDFLNGDFQFTGNSTSSITNLGAISASGGNVFLIADKIDNKGSITASGVAGLAAGQDVLLTEGGDRLLVRPNSGASGSIENSGSIQGAQAVLKAAGGNVYALAIKNDGTIRATGSETVNGRVLLKAQGSGISSSGTISSRNLNGSGGSIELGGGVSVGVPSNVNVTGTLDASAIEASEALLISKLKGGSVTITGQEVNVGSTARISANGASGGGRILVGGDYQGKNDAVQNAVKTTVGEGAEIEANALTKGDGGKVIVWSDQRTEFAGTISAKGGAQGGDGGFAEVSGKQHLQYRGLTDLRADYGEWGTLLLDPNSINIVATAPGVDDILVSTINGALSNVLITASVDISVQTPVNMTNAGVSLQLTAPDINLNADVTTNNANQLYSGAVHVGTDLVLTAGTGTVAFGSTVSSAASNDFTVDAQFIKLFGDVIFYQGDQFYDGQVVLENDITVSSGMGGDITFNGAIKSFGGANDLTLSIANGYDLNFNQAVGDVSSAIGVDDLIISGGGNVYFNPGAVTKVNSFTYTGTSGASLTLDSDFDVLGNATISGYDVTVKKLFQTFDVGSGADLTINIDHVFTQEDLGDLSTDGFVKLLNPNGTGSAVMGGGTFGDGVAQIVTRSGVIQVDMPITLLGNVRFDTTGTATAGNNITLGTLATVDGNTAGVRDFKLRSGTGTIDLKAQIGSSTRLDEFQAEGGNITVEQNITANSIDLSTTGLMTLSSLVTLNGSSGDPGDFTIQMEANSFSLGTSVTLNSGALQGLGVRSNTGFNGGSTVLITAGLLGFEGSGNFNFANNSNQISQVATGNAGVNGNVTVYSSLSLEVAQTTDPDGNPINGIKIVGTGNTLYLQSDGTDLNVTGQIIGQGAVTLSLLDGGTFHVGSQIDTGNGDVTFTAGGPSTVNLGADITTDSGNVLFDTGVDVVLTASKTINTNWNGTGTGGSITFSGNLGGAYNLTLNAGTAGDISFQNFGPVVPLDILIENADIVNFNAGAAARSITVDQANVFNMLAGSFVLTSTGTALDVNASDINLSGSSILATGGLIHLKSTDASGINATGTAIGAYGIALEGVGPFNFGGAKNISIWAADVVGTLTIGNSTGTLTVGSIAGVDGLRSTGSSININNNSSISVNRAISSKLDTTINSAGSLVFGSGGSLNAANAALYSFGDLQLGPTTIGGTLSLNQGAAVTSNITQTGAIQAATLSADNSLGSILLDDTSNQIGTVGLVSATGDIIIGTSGMDLILSDTITSSGGGLITVFTDFGNDVVNNVGAGVFGSSTYTVYTTTESFLNGLTFAQTVNAAGYPASGLTSGQNNLVLLGAAEDVPSLDNVDTQPYMNPPDENIILTGEDPGNDDLQGVGRTLIAYKENDSDYVDNQDGTVGMDNFGNTLQVKDPKIIILLKVALDTKAQQELLDAIGITLEDFNDAAGGNMVTPGEYFDMSDLSSGSLASAPKALQDALSDKAKAELEAALGEILEAQGSLDGVYVVAGQAVDIGSGQFLPDVPPILVIALSPIAQFELEQAIK